MKFKISIGIFPASLMKSRKIFWSFWTCDCQSEVFLWKEWRIISDNGMKVLIFIGWSWLKQFMQR